MEEQFSPPSITQQLQAFKSQIKKSILSDSFLLPLYNYEKVFDFVELAYIDKPKNQISLNSKTIWTLTRLLQIVQIALKLIDKEEIITKRNLYYKLVKYYQDKYNQVDADLDLLCSNLKLNRQELRIFSSSRCLLFGHLDIYNDRLTCQPSVITNIPIFDSNAEFETKCNTLVIVEKESALYEIHQLLSRQNSKSISSIKEETIFISSKGFPDGTTKTVVARLLPFVENIYFLGDSDIYGLDILLCYAIAYKQWPCLLSKLNWIQLQKLVSQKLESLDYLNQKKQDKLRCISMLERPYFKDIDFVIPKNKKEEVFKQKMTSWKQKVREIHRSQKKIELECLFKELADDWIQKAFLKENCL